MFQKNRAWIELDLKNLENNVRELQALLTDGCKLMPAVKADAYGHGAVAVSAALQSMGIDSFCVACTEEGIELRKGGITGDILILGYTDPALFPSLTKYHLTQTVIDREYARILNRFGERINVHIGIDTGMHRLGERSTEEGKILSMWEMKNLHITGMYSHLCVSDGTSDEERGFTEKQIRSYNTLIENIRNAGVPDFKTHLQGSYGILNYPELHYDYVRPGIALYGTLSHPWDITRCPVSLKPVLSLKARIQCIHILHEGEKIGYGQTYTAPKESMIAVVSIGYADGIPRQLSNKGYALINGHKVAIIGRICMDQLFLDITDIPDVNPGDEAVFIGTSEGYTISADMAAYWAGTISNEILSRLGKRLPRIIRLR